MLENVGIVDTDDHVADQENAGPSPAKKKRTKTTEIQLENAPQDEVTVKNPKLNNNLMCFSAPGASSTSQDRNEGARGFKEATGETAK